MANKHSLIVDRVLTRLKLKQLRLLVSVGKHQSILHAAKELNISQPAATKMIKDLELDFETAGHIAELMGKWAAKTKPSE